jgi:DNA-binding NtrC family response regulator
LFCGCREPLRERTLRPRARRVYGATDNKPGLFEIASGGTLFLDEIGELPQGMQAKLLRVLETGEVQRVGSLSPTQVDVHVIAATHRDLRADADVGRFRSDLFYRLNVVELRVPSLGERREDIPYLTSAFVRDSAARFNKKIIG